MLHQLRVHVVMPLLARLGTAGALYLAPYLPSAEFSQQVELVIVAVLLLGWDLGVGYLNRKYAIDKKLERVLGDLLAGSNP